MTDPNAPLSLTDFRASVDRVTDPVAAAKRIGVDFDYFDENCGAVLIYDGTCWIEEWTDGTFGLLLDRDYHNGSREFLEAQLWAEHYISEHGETGQTTALLTQALQEYSRVYDLEPASADEMLAEHAQTKHAWWLGWFIGVWETVQEREDRAAIGIR